MDKNLLDILRSEIDSVDRELSILLQKRMDLVNRVAEYKRKTQTKVLDEAREQKVLENVLSVVTNPDYNDSIKASFESIMTHSRDYQKKRLSWDQDLSNRFVLIGEKLSHSLSPVIHGLFFEKAKLNGSYDLLEAPQHELSGLLTRLKKEGYSGANVTIPYKTEIMSYLDTLSDEALRVGAVNTIKLGAQCSGYNTDYQGFGWALEYCGIDAKGKACAVLGTGGSSRAVVAWLKDQGASRITLVTRDIIAACSKYPDLQCMNIKAFRSQGYDLVVNTTPLGMSPKVNFSPLSKEQLQGAGFVMDIIYNPDETLLLRYAHELGIPYANGLYMLVAQGICAQEIWQGKSYSQDMVNGIYEEIKA